MIILGIDPGYAILGWSVIKNDLTLIQYGTIESDSSEPFENRLLKIHNELSEIIERYKPDCVSMEKLFFQKNTKTAIDVAKVLGAVILTVTMLDITYFEYTPSQVKMALTGFGRASKEQIQHMVKTIFKLENVPKPDDAADALAIAACHSFRKIY